MALWDSLTYLFRRDAEHLERVTLLPDHIFPPPDDTAALTAGEGYFRLWAVQMFLKSDRDWFKTWYPVVQSLTTFRFGNSNGPIELAQIAGPRHLRDVDPAHLDRIVQLDHDLTPLIPFNGGTVQIEAGLIAMQASDLLQSFLNVMSGMARLLTAPQLSSVVNIADTFSKSVEQFLGVGSNRLILGCQKSFVGAGGGGTNLLAPAYFALMNTASGTYAEEQLWVKDSSLLYGPDLNKARELTGVDYMLLRIETRKNRDDWDALTSISHPWAKAIDALSQVDASGNPKVADAEMWVRAAAVAALNSPDLTNRDRIQVARAIRERYGQYVEALGLGTDTTVTRGLRGMRSTRGVPEIKQAPTLAEVASEAENLAENMDVASVSLGDLFAG